MSTYFHRIDFDKDGAITRADFEGMAKRFMETGKLSPDRQTDMLKTLTAVSRVSVRCLCGGVSLSAVCVGVCLWLSLSLCL